MLKIFFLKLVRIYLSQSSLSRKLFRVMTEVKKEKLELQIKLEKANLEGTNQTVQDQIRIKQELIKSEIKREQLVLEETREEHPPPSPPAPKKQISKVRPQRPQKNAISLAKVAAIDTQDLFTYDNKLSGASPTKSQTSPSVKEMRSNQPDIETENQRYPTLTNIHRSKKRQNIDNLFDKYDSGIRIFNEDGSLETETEELRTEITKSPQDQELEFLFSAPKRLRSEKSKNSNEKVQIDEITNKYNFVENTDDTAVPFDDDVILNRSFSNEFSVRIKCRRHVYSYPIRQDSAFTETIEKLAKKLQILPKQIMLIHREENILHTDTPAMINLDENTILDSIILSSEVKSPTKLNEPKIKIKIQFAKNLCGLVPIMAPLTADLNGILAQICESKDLTPSQFNLQFDGEQMELSKTLQDYDLEDGDVIDAIMVT